ncbi:MAG: site-specific integrase [Planctomycetes bacterium]|nr:site-specific integrase [Planctomycetota bacterium]
MRRKSHVPGCIFSNHGRYWWRVRLPGERRKTAHPLVPDGGRHATSDPRVAEEVARNLYARAVFKAEGKSKRQRRSDGTVAELARDYLEFARGYYVRPDGTSTGETRRLRYGVQPLIELYPSLPAEEFRPRLLKEVRQHMIDANLRRTTINKRVNMIKRMFRWAVQEERVPPSVLHGLEAVTGLKRGRSPARESRQVRPVDEFWVRKTMTYLPPVVAAMVELQMLTGMRSGELCIMRPMDVDTRGKVWLYRPRTHKTEHHGHRRVVPIGPRGRAILQPYLARRVDAYCFSPAEAQAERNADKRERRETPVQPSQQNRRKPNPAKHPGDRYDACSYRRAIDYAITAANRVVRKAAREPGEKVKETDLVPRWHPHQLRHTAATVIRREMGLDAARALLGHRSLGITDTYAELDQALAVEAARKLG